MHDDSLPITDDVVRRLVDRSFPDYRSLRLRPLGNSGSSNRLYRLGHDLVVRMPRQPGGSVDIDKEARWAPLVAHGVGPQVPEVIGVGEPGFGYPERWSVTTWLEGRTPQAGVGSAELGRDLAELIVQLRALPLPTGEAAPTSYRGGPLAALEEDFAEACDACLGMVDLGLDLRGADEVWNQAVAAQRRSPTASSWLHGDLLAENVLVRDGRLSGLLDLGGLAVGDPTVDLIVAWEVLSEEGRTAFRAALEVDDDVWATARGWALLIALITFPYYWESMPQRCADRRVLAAAVLSEVTG